MSNTIPTRFPDVEVAVLAYLAEVGELAGTQLTTLVPRNRPTEFIRVERLGGPRETRVTEAAQIAVEAWATDDTRAVELLNICRGHLYEAEGALFGVNEYGGPTRLPDPDSNMARYTASFTIRARAIQ